MKKVCSFFCLILCAIFLCGCSAISIDGTLPDSQVDMSPRKISASSLTNFEEIVSQVTPAVVGISAIYSNVESVGSGVAVAQNGYILTNNHVVEGANNITVYFANKTSMSAKLIWNDSAIDLAVIKVEKNMPYLEMGNSKALQPGADVVAIGTPLTLQFKHTTTKGIVSALDRTIEVDNSDGTVSYLQNLIQHDSSINPGNSGGPLINSSGEVVGINTLKVTEAEGLGFAIPIEVAVPVLSKILQTGKCETPYLGLFGFDAVIAKFYNKTLQTNGVYVLNIDQSGPAYQAGLREGDVIQKLNGININTMLDLRSSIYNFDIGETITVEYLRNGIKQSANLILTKRP